MYRIELYDKVTNQNYILQDSIDNVVINPVFNESVNSANTLSFSLHNKGGKYDFINELSSIVSMYNEHGQLEFKGRLIDKSQDFGLFISYTFEGELAYLNDIQYPPYEHQDSINRLLDDVLSYYNSHCSNDKKILLGQVTVSDNNDYIYRSNEEYSSCWDVINDKLVKLIGGYVKIRYVGNDRYLDYLINPGVLNQQKIEFGKNLLNLEQYIDSSTVGTVLIPLGAKDEESGQRLTISSVNNGLNYLESNLIDTFGRIEQVQVWDDVTIAENLLSKANSFLSTMILNDISINVSAVDLGFTSQEITHFRVGDSINVVSPPHNFNITMMLTQRNRNINDPASDTLTLGTESKMITSNIISNQKKSDDSESKLNGNFLDYIVNKQTSTLLGGLGGYIKFKYIDGKPVALLAMDTENEQDARNIVMLNQNGFGFSSDGGNSFRNAWTIDGILNADFIRTGILAGECFEFNLNTGRCIWGRRDSNYQFIANSTMEFNAESLMLDAKRGIIIDNGETLFRSQLTESFMEFTYDSNRLLRLDPTGLESENITVNRYITLRDTSRIERIEYMGNVYTGHFSLGGN